MTHQIVPLLIGDHGEERAAYRLAAIGAREPTSILRATAPGLDVPYVNQAAPVVKEAALSKGGPIRMAYGWAVRAGILQARISQELGLASAFLAGRPSFFTAASSRAQA